MLKTVIPLVITCAIFIGMLIGLSIIGLEI